MKSKLRRGVKEKILLYANHKFAENKALLAIKLRGSDTMSAKN